MMTYLFIREGTQADNNCIDLIWWGRTLVLMVAAFQSSYLAEQRDIVSPSECKRLHTLNMINFPPPLSPKRLILCIIQTLFGEAPKAPQTCVSQVSTASFLLCTLVEHLDLVKRYLRIGQLRDMSTHHLHWRCGQSGPFSFNLKVFRCISSERCWT